MTLTDELTETPQIGIIAPISPLTNAPLDMATMTQVVPELAVDETGGMTALMDILMEKTSANALVDPQHPAQVAPIMWDPITAEELEAAVVKTRRILDKAQRKSPGLFRRALTRLSTWAQKALRTARESAEWLCSDIPNPKLIQRTRNRFFGYKGRHHVARTWFGVQRSTAGSVSITRARREKLQQTSNTKEGVLSSYYAPPTYYMSHLASIIESLRDDHAYLHPGPERHWQCQ